MKQDKNIENLILKAGELGIGLCTFENTSKIVVSNWVLWKCKYGCKYYRHKLTCPPFAPTPEETKLVMAEYSHFLFLRGNASWKVRYAVGELEKEAFLLGFHKAFALGAGPCMLCDTCVAADSSESCRYPASARPSMEACGIDVFTTAANMGFPIKWQGDISEKKQLEPDVFGALLLF